MDAIAQVRDATCITDEVERVELPCLNRTSDVQHSRAADRPRSEVQYAIYRGNVVCGRSNR